MDVSAEDKVSQLCGQMNIPTPIEFLTRLMGGTDPRRVSHVYLKIKELEETYGEEPPDEQEWMALVDLIKCEYRHSIIDISKSQDAAKQLMEYMHPKRKAVEVTKRKTTIDQTPLSRREVKLLRKEFDLDY